MKPPNWLSLAPHGGKAGRDAAWRALCSLAFGWLIALVAGPAAAADLTLMPVAIHLDRERDRATVHVVNNGTEAATVQADAIAWTREGGQDRDGPTDALIVNPPVFTVQPGQTQIVRVGLRRNSATTQEATYRMVLRELPPPEATLRPGVAGSLRVLVAMRVPVYVAPMRVHQDTRVTAHLDADGHVVAHVSNHGNVHLKVGMLRLRDEQATALAEDRSGAVLFPGEARSYRLPARGAGADARLRLEMVTNQGVRDVALQAAGP